MRKILSIFMVAVLSLNLLCQPCEAMNNPQMDGGYQQYQLSVSHSQGKNVGCIGRIFNFVKTAVKVVFVISACLGGFIGFIAGVAVGSVGGCNCTDQVSGGTSGGKFVYKYFSSIENMPKKCLDHLKEFLKSNNLGCAAANKPLLNEIKKRCYEVD